MKVLLFSGGAPKPLFWWLVVSNVVTFHTIQASYVKKHTFSVKDVLGGFNGKTFFDDNTIVCGVEEFTVDGVYVHGSSFTEEQCKVSPITDKSNNKLYPIDSEFGFAVVDFVGAVQKTRDNDYQEGYAGNIMDGPNVIGLNIGNAATSFYKVPPPLGTWCQGIGGNSVKCSTEHFSVMEHILTCHETIPYMFVEEPTQCSDVTQAIQSLKKPDGTTLTVDCADKHLDNNLYQIVDGIPGDEILDLKNLEPNDNTDALYNIAVGKETSDYSITLKDDGKVLFRWGNLIKRPTDIRLYAKIPLPPEWKNCIQYNADGECTTWELIDKPVTMAYLYVDHLVTNNPNDQLRAEDLENEGATGRKPNYVIGTDGRWRSLGDCYEGDADLIMGGDTGGELPAVPLPNGTIFKQLEDCIATDTMPDLPCEDLREYYTNAFYTSIQRDPFEWSYRKMDTDDAVHEFIGSPVPLFYDEMITKNLELISGPRWRLKANKFGQDIPGLEIPRKECDAPPFKADNIKYEVGQRITTVINLLDWNDDEGASPLATTLGWMDAVEKNDYVKLVDRAIVPPPEGSYGVTTNGLPMSEDFDLAVYIKGDKKPTAIYSATLVLNWEGATDTTLSADLAVTILGIDPEKVTFGNEFTVSFKIENLGDDAAWAKWWISYTDNKNNDVTYPEKTTGNEVPAHVYEPDGYEIFSHTFAGIEQEGDEGNVRASVTVHVTPDASPVDGIVIEDTDLDNNKDSIDFQIKK